MPGMQVRLVQVTGGVIIEDTHIKKSEQRVVVMLPNTTQLVLVRRGTKVAGTWRNIEPHIFTQEEAENLCRANGWQIVD